MSKDTTAPNVLVRAVTLTTAGATLASLLGTVPASFDPDAIISFQVRGLKADGTSRAAVLWGESAAQALARIPAGADEEIPVEKGNTVLKSTTGGNDANVVVVVYYR